MNDWKPKPEEINGALEAFTIHGKTIPEHMRPAFVRYLCDGIIPGDFLRGVLANDLRATVMTASDENLELLPVYVSFLDNHAPEDAWGSRKAIREWAAAFARDRGAP